VEVGGAQPGLGYTGEWWDESLEMAYLRARWYDAQVGRFARRDPFPGLPTQPQTQNPYPYAANSPVIYTDSSGEFPPLPLWLILILITTGGCTAQYTPSTDPGIGCELVAPPEVRWFGFENTRMFNETGYYISQGYEVRWQVEDATKCLAVQWFQQVIRGSDGYLSEESLRRRSLDTSGGVDAPYPYTNVEEGVDSDVIVMTDDPGVRCGKEDVTYQHWFNAWPRLMENTSDNHWVPSYVDLNTPPPVAGSTVELGVFWSCTAGSDTCPEQIELQDTGQIDIPPLGNH
jgi:RHS repeat-associated protein